MFNGVAVSATVAALGHFDDLGGMVLLVAIAVFARALRHGGLGTGVVLGLSAALGSIAAWLLGAYDVASGHGADVKDLAFTLGGAATIGFGILTALADLALYAQASTNRSGPEQSR